MEKELLADISKEFKSQINKVLIDGKIINNSLYMNKTNKIFYFLCSLIFLASCKPKIDIEYIKSTGWSYSDGYRVTDYCTFDKSGYYSIKNDTLFVDNIPRAIIICLDKKSYNLTIRSLDGKQIGHYMDDREMIQ